MSSKKTAVFFDRDGVINDVIDRGENFVVAGKAVRWTAPFNYGELKIKAGVLEALALVKKLKLLSILVTNQPDISYGTLSKDDHERIMKKISALCFDDIFVCLHGRNDKCDCKKPKPGLLLKAADKWDIDLFSSYFVGDTENDILAGKTVGCKTILIESFYSQNVVSDFRVGNVFEAAKIIEKNIT